MAILITIITIIIIWVGEAENKKTQETYTLAIQASESLAPPT